jgi:hypothetical protein
MIQLHYIRLMLILTCALSAGERTWATTIAAAKALPLGTAVVLEDVTISNTIDLVNSGFSASFNVQDGSGGTSIFGSNADIAAVLAGLSAGDRIDVSGTTSSFNGLFQIAQPSLATSLVTAGVGVPTPIVTSSTDYQDFSPTAESLEGTLVSLSNVHFTGLVPGQTFAGTTNYNVTDGINDVIVRIQTTNISLIGDLIPTGSIRLTGIFSQFDVANPLPGVSGVVYELLPLDDSSISLVPEPGSCLLVAIAVAAISLVKSRRRS